MHYQLIDEMFPPHPQNHITTGQVVKAMALNYLGFLSAPLYLFSEFFESRPIEHLLGEGIEAKHLNDDRMGRVLDQLWNIGLSSLFVRLAMAAVAKFDVSVKQTHLDSSSFAVHGDYLTESNVSSDLSTASPAEPDIKTLDESEPVSIEVRRDYSRDHRPDLKQFVTNLCCSRDGSVPLFLEVASGNQSDRQHFGHLMREVHDQWNIDTLFIVDAVFYSEPNIQRVENLRWISRVPLTLGEAQTLIHQDTNELKSIHCPLKDYKLWQTQSSYGGIEQRWILVESQMIKAQPFLWEKELKRVEQDIKRRGKRLQKQVFSCRPDALEALLQFQETLEHHHVDEVTIQTILVKRAPGEKKSKKRAEAIEGYQLQFSWQRNSEVEKKLTEQRLNLF